MALLPRTDLESSLPHTQPSLTIVYNMPIINNPQPPARLVGPSFPHPVLAFIVPIVLNAIEIKCQCKGDSPFDTNPVTMWFTLSCLAAYCLAYGIELRVSSSATSPNCSSGLVLLRNASMLFGSLSLVSLTSVLLPSVKPFLFGFGGLLLIGDMSQSVKMVWAWIDERIVSKFFRPCKGQQVERNILPV